MAKSRGDSEGKGVSQMEMVRLAMEELGGDAKPLAIQEHIKAKFNKELPPTIISNYKSVLKRKANGGSPAPTGGATRGRKPAGSTVNLADLEAVRALVSRIGAGQVKKLVEFFS